MNSVHIRSAQPQDVAALAQLAIDFHEFHVSGMPSRLISIQNDIDKPALQKRLVDIMHQSDAALFVAEENGRLLGFIELYLREDEPNPARAAYRYVHVQSLMVQQSTRNSGIGTQLMKTAHNWAKTHQADEVRLDVWEFADGPLPFYEKLGYQTIKRSLAYKLSP